MPIPEPFPAPQPLRLDTEAGPLALRSLGSSGPALVLWPSILTDHHIHLRLARHLAGQARVVLIDGPGHGDSGAAPAGASIATHARGMAAAMDALGIDRAVVGGTSWGGLVGAELALAQPERVAGLVLMNTPLHIEGARPGLRARLIALGARLLPRSRTFRNGVARSFFLPRSLESDPGFRDAFHAMLHRADAAALAASVRAVILRGTPLAARLDRIAAPVLMIAGTEDRMYPLAATRAAAARLRDGRLLAVPGRHISAVDAPDQVAAALAAFLSDLPR